MDRKRQAARALAIDGVPSRRSTILLAAAGCAAFFTLWLVASTPAQTSANRVLAESGTNETATRITIAAGSPTEFRFKLSKLVVPTGVVTFVVKNKGHLPHDFKIAGKTTRLLKPGQSQTMKVTFRKKGSYLFLCTVSGHAAAGMKGTVRVK
jgi:uncharacterized cupredoxin-like copper-binding protein